MYNKYLLTFWFTLVCAKRPIITSKRYIDQPRMHLAKLGNQHQPRSGKVSETFVIGQLPLQLFRKSKHTKLSLINGVPGSLIDVTMYHKLSLVSTRLYSIIIQYFKSFLSKLNNKYTLILKMGRGVLIQIRPLMTIAADSVAIFLIFDWDNNYLQTINKEILNISFERKIILEQMGLWLFSVCKRLFTEYVSTCEGKLHTFGYLIVSHLNSHNLCIVFLQF